MHPLMGKVTEEFYIGLREMKALAFEQMCLEAPEFIIQNFVEEK